MTVLFGSKDLCDIVENGSVEPEVGATLSQQQLKELKDNQKNDRKALLLIYQKIDEVVFERISSSSTAKET